MVDLYTHFLSRASLPSLNCPHLLLSLFFDEKSLNTYMTLSSKILEIRSLCTAPVVFSADPTTCFQLSSISLRNLQLQEGLSVLPDSFAFLSPAPPCAASFTIHSHVGAMSALQGFQVAFVETLHNLQQPESIGKKHGCVSVFGRQASTHLY